MARRLRAVVVGAGMAGILAAIRLRDAGDEVVVLEKGDSAGGTWRENRYAGLTCDVPAHSYTYSFAPYPEWSRYFATGPEIKRYFDHAIDTAGIRDVIRFGEEVVAARWTGKKWEVEASSGNHYDCDVLIAATGVLHHPRMPEIDGLTDFEGECFHSARWPEGLDFAGKRVSVIGNGSTGVQIVTALAGVASQLNHFQRSPQWIMPVQDFAYSEEDKARFRSDPAAIDALRYEENYLSNIRNFNNAIIDPDSSAMIMIETAVRTHLEQSVSDPELRAKLTPDYRAACKRLIFSPSYYQQVQHPDVDIVRAAIERVEPTGVRTREGTLYESDVIILATGFLADRFVRPIAVTGHNGVSLDEIWAVRPRAYLAILVPDLPNFFMLNGPGGPVGNFSLIEIAEAQWSYIDQLLAQLRSGTTQEVEVSRDAFMDYEEKRIAAARKTIFATGCSSWYLDSEGVPQTWPWTYDRFFEAMRSPDPAAFNSTTPAEAAV